MSNKHQGIGQADWLAIGYGNFVPARRIVAILEPNSLPVKRMRERAGERDRLVDGTAGRKMRSVIITDSEHIVLSALATQTLQERLQPTAGTISRAELELRDGEFFS